MKGWSIMGNYTILLDEITDTCRLIKGTYNDKEFTLTYNGIEWKDEVGKLDQQEISDLIKNF